jgi:hypothetical protein
MKYLLYFVALAVFAVGCTALNDLAINVDAHDAVDQLQDQYNVCWECPFSGTITGGNAIHALRRAKVYSISGASPAELHRVIDVNTK